MNNESEDTIDSLIKELKALQLQQSNIDKNITEVQQRISTILFKTDTIGPQHIGRKCKVLNPNAQQPTEGTIIGFTKGIKPFVKIKKKGFSEIKRLPKNLRLMPKKDKA